MEYSTIIKEGFDNYGLENDNFFQSLDAELRSSQDWKKVLEITFDRAKVFITQKSEYQNEWKHALLMTICGCLAYAKENSDIDYLLKTAIESNLFKEKTTNSNIEFSSEEYSSRSNLSHIFGNYEIIPPFNSAWMVCLINRFQSIDSKLCEVSVPILLVDEKKEQGFQAKLSLVAYKGVDTGLITYPDPTLMLFTRIYDDFQNSIKLSSDFAWSLAKKHYSDPIEICWRISKDNKERIKIIKGKSLGAAFGIGILKLLGVNSTDQQNIPDSE